MEASRRTSLLTGLFFILTFVASIPAALFMYRDVVEAGFVLGAGGDARVYLGAFLEVVTVIANIATAVVLYPVVKRASESVALGYVASRTLESTVIVVGLISLLAVVAMRADLGGATGADPSMYETAGRALVAVHDATFLLGPAFCAGFGNGILLGYLMYRTGLVPRPWAVLGMVGGTIAFATATAVLFGAYEQTSSINALFTLPEIGWEAFLGIYLTFWGFRKVRVPTVDASAPAVVAAAV